MRKSPNFIAFLTGQLLQGNNFLTQYIFITIFSFTYFRFFCLSFRYKSSLNCDVGVQWNNILFATNAAAGGNTRNNCALLIDEMIITNGIVYSVSQQKVFGLAELGSHEIKKKIYQNFYGMDPDNQKEDDFGDFTKTAEKLSGNTATGLTQVSEINSIIF